MPSVSPSVKQKQRVLPCIRCFHTGACVQCLSLIFRVPSYGEMAERFKAHAWKVCVR